MRNLPIYVNNSDTPLNADDFNAQITELENVVTSADLSLDPVGGPDTDLNMLGKTLAAYGSAGNFYQDGGSANAYVLSRSTNLKDSSAYYDGMQIVFYPGNANTGASTVNVSSLGVKNLKDANGNALAGGELDTNFPAIFAYRASPDEFQMLMQKPLSAINGKNYIINGMFDVWQRNTTQTTSGYGSDDRWVNLHSGSTKTTSQQAFTLGQTDVPNAPVYYSRTVVSSSAGASNFCKKGQRIEGVETLSNKTIVLSFYAKADSSKDIALSYSQNFGTGGSPSSSVNGHIDKASLTTSWQKFTMVFAVPSISGKTLGSGGDDKFSIHFWFDAGSDYNTETDSLGQQSGTFDIANVKLEIGTIPTPLLKENYGDVLRKCQRFYEEFDMSATDIRFYITTTTNNSRDFTINYKVTKRSDSGTLTLTGGSPGTPNIRTQNREGASLNYTTGDTTTAVYFDSWSCDDEL